MTEANTSRPGCANVEGRAVSDDNTPIRLIASTSSTSPAKPTAGPLRPSVQRPVAPWRSLCLRAPVSRATGCRPFRRPARGRVAHLAIERSGPFESRPSSPLRPASRPLRRTPSPATQSWRGQEGKQRPGKRSRRFPNTHAPESHQSGFAPLDPHRHRRERARVRARLARPPGPRPGSAPRHRALRALLDSRPSSPLRPASRPLRRTPSPATG